MSTHIHVSGLSYFCTDDKLRQAFTPFGTVVLAQVLRDECGHSLGLGVVHMGCSEDVERVFNEHQRFEVSGSRVDLWEPAEPEGAQALGSAQTSSYPAAGALFQDRQTLPPYSRRQHPPRLEILVPRHFSYTLADTCTILITCGSPRKRSVTGPASSILPI